MRSQHHVGQRGETGCERGLALEHVQGRRSDAALAQCAHQRGLIDDRPARGVDEHRARLHARELRGTDQVARLGRERNVQRHVVGALEQLVKGRATAPAVQQHFHAKAPRPLRQRTADAPGAHDAERATGHVQTHAQPGRPADKGARAHVAVRPGDAASGGQQQREGQVRGRVGQHVGRIGDRDAEPLGGGQVDVVGAHRHVRDDPQAIAGRQHRLVDPVAEQAQEAVDAADLLGSPPLHVQARALEQAQAGLGDTRADPHAKGRRSAHGRGLYRGCGVVPPAICSPPP